MNFKSTWDCPVDPNEVVPAGTTAIFPYVWGFKEEGLTPPKDMIVVLEKDLTYGEVLELVEKEALDYVTSQGASDIRHYYIEDIQFKDGILTFIYGT